MSLFAGIYARDISHPRYQAIKQKLLSALTLADSAPTVTELGPLWLVRHSDRCFGENETTQSEVHFATCVGAPLLSDSLAADLSQLRDNPAAKLADAQGVFTLLHFHKRTQVFSLFHDRLALKPTYWRNAYDGTVFSNQLSTLSALPLPLSNHPVGLAAMATLGYPLGEDTPYREIRCARPGECLQFDGQEVSRHRHLDWVAEPSTYLTLAEAAEQLDAAFDVALTRSLGRDCTTVSTLSGGLDSRLIAAALMRRGVKVKCLNFSRPDSQDSVCAQLWAEQSGIPLSRIAVDDTQSQTVEQRLGAHLQPGRFPPIRQIPRPRMVWSGNGGSVCVGGVYFGREIEKAAQSGDVEATADAFLAQQQAYLPTRLLAHGQALQQDLKATVISELARDEHRPLARRLQLFLWHNDQHRHLAAPFEDYGDYRLEFHLPFYSAGVLAAVLSAPPEAVCRHQLYMSWIERCFPQMLCTPWQTYPGHLPCPLPLPGLDQWTFAGQRSRHQRGQMIRAFWQGQRHNLVQGRQVALLCLADRLGLRDAGPSLKALNVFNRYGVSDT
ncbi:hypothetical protein KUV89_01175 [Marinobacter hydrocarbonoclasticus]|nr:hypothetical protein [Marinobacter nauticus]